MFLIFIVKNLEDIFLSKLCLYMYAFIFISKMKNDIAVKLFVLLIRYQRWFTYLNIKRFILKFHSNFAYIIQYNNDNYSLCHVYEKWYEKPCYQLWL